MKCNHNTTSISMATLDRTLLVCMIWTTAHIMPMRSLHNIYGTPWKCNTLHSGSHLLTAACNLPLVNSASIASLHAPEVSPQNAQTSLMCSCPIYPSNFPTKTTTHSHDSRGSLYVWQFLKINSDNRIPLYLPQIDLKRHILAIQAQTPEAGRPNTSIPPQIIPNEKFLDLIMAMGRQGLPLLRDSSLKYPCSC